MLPATAFNHSRLLATTMIMSMILMFFVTTVSAQPPSPVTNNPRTPAGRDDPGDKTRRRSPVAPRTTTPSTLLVPSTQPTPVPVVVTTHAPNPPRAPQVPRNHRGPTDPPTKEPTRKPTSPPTPAPPPPCFSKAAMVPVLGKGETRITDLRIGDYVLNAKGQYDMVYTFAHRAPNKLASFLKIYTNHKNSTKHYLEVSKEHLLLVNGGVAVPASSIRVGDQIDMVVTGGVNRTAMGNGNLASSVVQKIETVVKRGFYTPYTFSGTIVVNDVAASVHCAAAYRDHPYNDGFWVAGFKIPLTIVALKHMYMAPPRLWFRIKWLLLAYSNEQSRSSWFEETYDDKGNSPWIAGTEAGADWFVQQNVVVMMVVFATWFCVGSLLYGLELVLFSNEGHDLGRWLLLVVIALASLRAVGYGGNATTTRKKKNVGVY